MNTNFYSDYSRISKIPVVSGISLGDVVPKKNLIEEETPLGRLRTLELERELWAAL